MPVKLKRTRARTATGTEAAPRKPTARAAAPAAAAKAAAANAAANAAWGGRYASGPAAIMQDINASIGFDRRMWAQDIAGSRAHARMLVRRGIISREDGQAIARGLGVVAREIAAGRFPFQVALEDIHMNVESRLAELVGDPAKRLHTARSRNDQVALDVRLWVRDAIDGLDGQMRALQCALVEKAEAHAGTVMPGFTHLQAAQPVTFGHHLLAYVEMLARDRGRLADCRRRMNESPLGAAALAGTSFPIDRRMTARLLGFERPMANSMDAVADRDYVVEFLAALSLCAVHLSRLAEEIVIWMSPPWRFIALSDAFTTGSSIMPQKRNPDAAELVRGKVGRIVGALHALLMIMKGLPLTYQKDMQEDKEPLFDAADAITLCLAAMAGMVRDMKASPAQMRAYAGAGYATATDLADWLVRALRLPFRTAHHVTGRLVRRAEQKGIGLEDLTLAEMKAEEPRITRAVFAVLGVDASVQSRVSEGGTAPANVAKQAAAWRKRLGMGRARPARGAGRRGTGRGEGRQS